MCTLTWLPESDGYAIFFNRDEQRSRARAKPPGYFPHYDAIMPIDPQGGGTWLALHRSELTLCLLNHYKHEVTAATNSSFASRGKVIQKLLARPNLGRVFENLASIDLTRFQAFRLCVFPPGFSTSDSSITVHAWDGKQLTSTTLIQPLISSAVADVEVTASRKAAWKYLLSAGQVSEKQHLFYHASHVPTHGKLSVCMHRSDAKTRSLAHVQVGKKTQYSYLAGSPCRNNDWTRLQFP